MAALVYDNSTATPNVEECAKPIEATGILSLSFCPI